MDKRNFLIYACIWLVSVLACVTSFGQGRDPARLAVDVVHLKNKLQIRGLVLSSNPTDEIVVAVSREWYEKEDLGKFLKAMENATLVATKAKLQLRDRLQKILTRDLPADGQVVAPIGAFRFFLQKELERVHTEIQNPPDDDMQFLVLRIKSATVSSLSRANDANRRIAVWSWHERLTDVESRKPSSLNIELKAKKIDPAFTPPNLANRFYATEESEDQWNVRLAIVSYRLDKPVEFQGSGESMLPIGSGQSPDIASLMGQMMQSQMSTLLEELSGVSKKHTASKVEETIWLRNAIAQAEKMNASYFRATHVRTDAALDIASVDSAFVVKLESGKWTIPWRANTVQSAAEQKEDTVRKVLNDPQIKALQTQFEALGVSVAKLDKAIRVGAATMAAQRLVNDEFQQFSESYLNRLSGPLIQLDK